jgi:hypothetical protein
MNVALPCQEYKVTTSKSPMTKDHSRRENKIYTYTPNQRTFVQVLKKSSFSPKDRLFPINRSKRITYKARIC